MSRTPHSLVPPRAAPDEAATLTPAAKAGLKVLDHLDTHCRNFIALSPFYVISSALTGGQTPLHEATRRVRWRTSSTTRRR